jgi:hypothetical protein
MRLIILTLFLGISSFTIGQDVHIEKWVQKIVQDMIEMEDLRKYSDREIPMDINLDLIMVESIKHLGIEGQIISMLVNHGAGNFCTELKFRYMEKDGEFYLVFDEPISSTILGKEHRIIKPWIEKNRICD